MTMIKRLCALFLAVAFASALGCTGSRTEESTGEYATDGLITTKVKAALVNDATVKTSEVIVETYRGVVQLSGLMSSSNAMYQAVRVARGIEGVTGVTNDMRVK
jgi:osmotically-inducible protein OsmY